MFTPLWKDIEKNLLIVHSRICLPSKPSTLFIFRLQIFTVCFREDLLLFISRIINDVALTYNFLQISKYAYCNAIVQISNCYMSGVLLYLTVFHRSQWGHHASLLFLSDFLFLPSDSMCSVQSFKGALSSNSCWNGDLSARLTLRQIEQLSRGIELVSISTDYLL